MPWALRFYRTADGRQPALEYIREQSKDHRSKIGRALEMLEDLGHEARRPLAEYLGSDIYELRVGIEHHQHRLLYFLYGGSIIVITSGLLKQKSRIPDADLQRAIQRRSDWLKRGGGIT